MTQGGDDRADLPYYGKARIRIATLLSATACALMLVDPFLPDYEVSLPLVVALLTTAGVLLGVEGLKRLAS